MFQLTKLLRGEFKPGVYLLESELPVEDLRQIVEENNHNFFYLDGLKISSKVELFIESETSFSFPDYFGRNWDAYYDLISTMYYWIPSSKGDVILYDRFENFASSSPDDFRTACSTLGSAVKRGNSPTPSYILLRGDRDLLPEDVRILEDD